MIKVKINKNTIRITGHAGFATYGKDIVCASASSIVIACANDMFTVDKEAISYDDNGEELVIQIIKEDELIRKLFNNLINLLSNLETDYPQNITLESEE